MRSTRLGAVVGGLTLFVALAGAPAYAAPNAQAADGQAHAPSSQVERRPAVADFEGRAIDLAAGWGDATACLVWRQGGVVECFRTAQAMHARAEQLAPDRAAQAGRGQAGGSQGSTGTGAVTAFSAYSCSSSLSLYDYGGYGGRELDFWDRGFWQNLGDYGFENATSSYIVGGCYSHLADYRDGAGWWYPGATSPYHGEAYMTWGWNDRVSSIYLE
jgi:hypothetical protein